MSEIRDLGSDSDVAAQMAELPDDVLFGLQGEDDPKAGQERGELDPSSDLTEDGAQASGEDDAEEQDGAETADESGEADDPEFEVVDPTNPEAKQTLKLSQLVQSHREYTAFQNEKAQIFQREESRAKEFATQRMTQVEQWSRNAATQLQAALQLVQPPQPPDPNRYLNRNSPDYDPDQYQLERHAFEQRKGTFEQAQRYAQHLTQQAEQIATARQEQNEQAELARLTQVWPEFGKPETVKSFIEDMVKHYGVHGVTADTLDSALTNHWMALIARDALEYRRQKAAGGDIKAKVVAKAAAKAPLQPASQSKRTLSREEAQHMQARQALKKSGGKDMRAAARAFEKFV